MRRCIRCVLPDTRPDTPFTPEGVCSACIAYDQRQAIDWTLRYHDLLSILTVSRMKHPHAPYDCIVPSSGGKDSTYQAITLMELGARPLLVTASTCHLTALGRANLDNLARWATTIEVTPSRATRAALNRIGLEEVGDPSWPEHAAIWTTPWRVAVAFGIPLIFYGENPQNQYGGPPGTEEEREMSARWAAEFGGFLGLRATDMAGKPGVNERDMADYRMPASTEGVQAYWLGQFLPWDSHHNAKVAIKWGLQYEHPSPANAWPWENLDNAQTGLHDHLMYRKYGYGRGCAQLSVDIRAGRVERARALDWVLACDGDFPYVYAGVDIAEALLRIGMSVEQLDAVLERFTNRELFKGERHRRPILKDDVA